MTEKIIKVYFMMMIKMRRFFSTIANNFVAVVSVSMFFGFVYGMIFPSDFLRVFIVPCAFFIVYPMMVNLNVGDVLKGGDIRLQVFAQFLNFCIIPFISFGVGWVFFKDNPYMLLGMLLIGLLPGGAGVIAWTGMLRGKLGSAIKIAIIGPIVGAILIPFYIEFLMVSALDVSLLFVMKRVALIIFIPMLLGIFTRKILIAKDGNGISKEIFVSFFPSFPIIGLSGMVFATMALQAKYIAQNPMMFGYILLPVSILYLINFILSTLLGRMFFDRSGMVAFVYGTSVKELSIALAIAMNLFDGVGFGTSLVVIVACIVQIQSAAWYAKLVDRDFIYNNWSRCYEVKNKRD